MKKVLFAVAGAGKTTSLVQELSPTNRYLFLTYTENNAHNLENAIIEKFKRMPDNIMVSTYFSFLLNFMIKPFLFKDGQRICRLHYSKDQIPRYLKGVNRFITGDGEEVFHSRAFQFACEYVGKEKMLGRLTKFFDWVFIDEVQDFAGYDFGFIEMLGASALNVLLTGDFFQHTFDTSRDGSKNKNLHDDFVNYKKHFVKWYEIDETTLSCSYRCPSTVCEFVSSKIGVQMSSGSRDNVAQPSLINDPVRIDEIIRDDQIKKLFIKSLVNIIAMRLIGAVARGLLLIMCVWY